MSAHDAVILLAKSGYLASIAGGGEASWILTSAGVPMAVVAQQWEEPRLIARGDATLASLAVEDRSIYWHFRLSGTT